MTGRQVGGEIPVSFVNTRTNDEYLRPISRSDPYDPLRDPIEVEDSKGSVGKSLLNPRGVYYSPLKEKGKEGLKNQRTEVVHRDPLVGL